MGCVLIVLCMAQFINRLMEAVPLGTVGEAGMALPGDTRSLQRHLCVMQLSRCLGLQHALSPDGKLALISELKHHYHHGLQFGKTLLKINCLSQVWACQTPDCPHFCSLHICELG